MKNVHIMPQSPYSLSFIDMIEKANLTSEEIFIVLTKSKNVINDNQNIIYFNYKNPKEYLILRKIQCDNLFFHSINTVPIIISKMIKGNINNKVWILWGYDLYKNLNINLYNKLTRDNTTIKENVNLVRKIEKYFIKKYVKRNIQFILNWNRFDIEIANKFFGKKFTFINFFYPLAIKKNDDTVHDRKDILNVMVGNSGDPSNNHFDIFYKLIKLNNNFNIISFLSYGNLEYIENVKKTGVNLFGDRFTAFTDFLPREKYYDLINDIDILILNHNRQQGVGNILPFINNKKTVVLNKEVSTYNALNEMGVKIFNTDDFDIDKKLSQKELDENSNIIYEHFNDEKQLKNYLDFINTLNR